MRSIVQAIRAGHWPSLAGAWLHFEVSFMIWLLIGGLGVLIAQDFALTPSQKGLLVAVPLLTGALLRIPVGVSSDRWGAKRTGLALLAGVVVALLWGWLGATSYVQVLGVGLLLGIAGASFAVALPLASRVYPPAHQGFALGVAAAGNSGVVLAAFFAPRLGEIVGWHGVFGLMTVPVVLTAILFYVMVRDDVGAGGRDASRPDASQTQNGFARPSMYWLCLLYAVTFGGFVGLSSFLPIFFHDEYGISPVLAGTLTAVCALGASVLRPVGGYVADRVGGLAVLRILFPAIGVLAFAIGRLPTFLVASSLMVLALALMGFGNGVVFQVVSDRFRDQMGLATGVVGAAGGLGGFFLPTMLGLLKDLAGTYGAGFLLFGGAALVAGITVEVAVRRKRPSVKGVSPLGSVSH